MDKNFGKLYSTKIYKIFEHNKLLRTLKLSHYAHYTHIGHLLYMYVTSYEESHTCIGHVPYVQNGQEEISIAID